MHNYKKPEKVAEVTLGATNRSATRDTLKLMAHLVNNGKKNIEVLQQARAIIKNVPSKDFAGEAFAVYEWVINNIRYTRDIDGMETLQSADITLDVKQGDCDDHAILTAALLKSVGHPVRLVAVKVGSLKNNYAHVYAETRIGEKYLPLDTTMPQMAAGWSPPDLVQRMIAYP